jgi:hypothetical protein
MRFTGVIFQLKTQWLILAAVWTVSIVVVNPVGEFTINDDWSFLRLAEILWSEGRIPATGWGTGGPSAVVHVLWGRLFGFFGGFSPTVMRLSVLTLGVLSSSVLLVLLHLAGASGWVALLGTLTLVFNPLFFSQCFTFMTDITFLCVMLSALLFLCLGLDRAGIFLIVIGMIFALLAVLTRQIGIVIPFGILATCLLHPKGKALGSCRMALLTVGVCILPWLAYESFLSAVGSTPVTEHEVFEHILAKPMSEGAFGYLVYLFDQFFLVTMGYCGFLVSPVLVLRYPEYWRQRSLRYLFVVLTGALVVLEAGIFTGLAHPPIFFYRNVIYDIGIGPLLLKDT